MENVIKNEQSPEYKIKAIQELNFTDDDQVIKAALQILKARLKNKGFSLTATCSTNAINYLTVEMSSLEHEEFHVLFLDSQLRLIKHKSLFRGTINSAAVYPREIVKEVLKYNAASVILAHNHPSGITSPSVEDKAITNKITKALKLIDVIVIDHIIIGGVDSYSFSEHGLI